MPPRSLFVDAERCIRALYQFDTGRCSGSFDATKPEFVTDYNEIAALLILNPMSVSVRIGYPAFDAGKKIGPHNRAAQV